MEVEPRSGSRLRPVCNYNYVTLRTLCEYSSLVASYAVVYTDQGEPAALLIEDERRVIVHGPGELAERLDDYDTPLQDRLSRECAGAYVDGPLAWEGSAEESLEPLSRLYFGSSNS